MSITATVATTSCRILIRLHPLMHVYKHHKRSLAAAVVVATIKVIIIRAMVTVIVNRCKRHEHDNDNAVANLTYYSKCWCWPIGRHKLSVARIVHEGCDEDWHAVTTTASIIVGVVVIAITMVIVLAVIAIIIANTMVVLPPIHRLPLLL